MANGQGGRRIGAGRKPGSGSPFRAATQERTLARVSAKRTLAEVLGTDDDPARVLIEIATAPGTEPRLRLEAAGMLMPYAYPKLAFTVTDSTVRHTGDGQAAMQRLSAALDRLAPAAAPTIDGSAKPIDPADEAA